MDRLEDIALKYDLHYGKVFDLYVLLEHRSIKKEYGWFGYLFADRDKYQDKIINTLNRYYRRKRA